MNITNLQAIVVLAGGSQKTDDVYTLPEYVKARLDKCYEIFSKNRKIKIILSSAGTPHRKPFINSNGYHVYECDSMARYLIEKYKVSHTNIYREYMSYDTIGNAYFSKTIFIDKMNITNFCVITSEFHFNRSKTIFNHIFNKIENNKYNIEFIKTDNIGANSDDINKRKIKEESSIKQFLTNIEEYNLNSEYDIFNWLFTHHNAYNTIGMITHKTNTSTQNVNNNDLTLY